MTEDSSNLMSASDSIPEHAVYRSQSIEASLTPPETPPLHNRENVLKRMHNWPEPESLPEIDVPLKRQMSRFPDHEEIKIAEFNVAHQEVLLLHGPKQKYAHTKEQPIPVLKDDREMLIEVEVVGLNPIDWKAPDFGFGLPALPCISGRDLAGRVVKIPKSRSRFRVNDTIMAVSTDYRDSRKSAYQQYAVVSDFNACRLPPGLAANDAASLGVAFVAAAIALGVCLGVDFSTATRGSRGPNVLRTIRSLAKDRLPEDIRVECFDKFEESERPRPGDWLAIWGGSSASGCIALQLAKLAGLKVVAVIDVARSGQRMLKYGADLLVDRLDTKRAVSILKGVTQGKLRFGLDTIGKETAALLAEAMSQEGGEGEPRSHLVGLTGLPKRPVPGLVYHSVPIKAFHEASIVGEELTLWLEKLLAQRALATPDIEVAAGGLEGINEALDKLRDGRVNGPRLVVPLRKAREDSSYGRRPESSIHA